MRDKDNFTAVSANATVGTRDIVLVVFDGVEALDVAAPASAFGKASELVPGAYRVILASPRGGRITSNSGFAIADTHVLDACQGSIDTLVVAGGDEAALRTAILEEGVGTWIASAAPRIRRVASICTGAFALAAAGLLDQRSATTHWNACALLQTLSPRTAVQHDRIFVQDGPVWTSAGVTTGLDLTLALIEADLGRSIAMQIARNLALFVLRGETQPQISPALQAQADASTRLRELLAWISGHLDQDHSVQALAERMCMSPRSFARVFAAETGTTPARFVTQARLNHASTLLRQTDWPQDKVAHRSGFGSVDAMARAFRQFAACTPTQFRATVHPSRRS